MAATTAFYEGVFGWTSEVAAEPEAGGYTTFRRDGKQVAAATPAQGDAPPAWLTHFATDSVDGAVKQATDAGARTLMEPFDVMGYGRMAVLADPTGAVFSLWQAGTVAGAELVNAPGAFAWTELVTRDVAAAAAFYDAVLHLSGNTIDYGGTAYTMLQRDGQPVAGLMAMDASVPPGAPAHWRVYFDVEDCDATVARATALGAQVTLPPTDTPAGRMAALVDPQGAHFAVIKSQPMELP
jgi:hypothetical protein